MLIAIITLFLALLLLTWRFNSYSNQKLPPGPIRWPIIGSIPQMLMANLHYPYRQFHGLSQKYGDLISIGFGSQYAVLISSFELMKDVLRRPEASMERFKFQFTQQRTNGKNLGIIWAGGNQWSNIRRYTVKKLREFGFGKTRSMEETMKEEVASLLDDMKLESEGTGGVWRVDPNRLSVFSINVLWSSVGGYRFDPKSPYIKTQVDLNIESFEKIYSATNLLSIFPFLRFFPRISQVEEHGKIHKRCQEFMKVLIQDAKVKRGGKNEAESVVEAFLDEIENHGKDKKGKDITEEQLEWVLADLFLAGSDTTSSVINWIILYLTLNPSVQAKARVEIDKVSHGGLKEIHLSDMMGMSYIRAIILETMRHSPFGAVTLQRSATADLLVGEYVIPKGACIFFNLYPVFHDPLFWRDPENFRPERFFDDDDLMIMNAVKVERVGSQFGFGKRVCPGEAIAMNSIFIFVVSLLSRFSLDVADGSIPTTDPGTPGATIPPQPYDVCLKELKSF